MSRTRGAIELSVWHIVLIIVVSVIIILSIFYFQRLSYVPKLTAYKTECKNNTNYPQLYEHIMIMPQKSVSDSSKKIINISNIRQDESQPCEDTNSDLKQAISQASSLEDLKKLVNISFKNRLVYVGEDNKTVWNYNNCSALVDILAVSLPETSETCGDIPVSEIRIDYSCYTSGDYLKDPEACPVLFQIQKVSAIKTDWLNKNSECAKPYCKGACTPYYHTNPAGFNYPKVMGCERKDFFDDWYSDCPVYCSEYKFNDIFIEVNY